jgi:hypothetical protein
MYSENGVLVDLEDVAKLVSEADVFTVGFSNFPERLIVDTRSNMKETPMVKVVEPASGPRDRLAWLQRRRPSLGAPRAFTFMAWPHSPLFMQETGVWDRIRRQVNADTDLSIDAQCEQALRELQNLDMQATLAVLRGERCLTLWPREENQNHNA